MLSRLGPCPRGITRGLHKQSWLIAMHRQPDLSLSRPPIWPAAYIYKRQTASGRQPFRAAGFKLFWAMDVRMLESHFLPIYVSEPSPGSPN